MLKKIGCYSLFILCTISLTSILLAQHRSQYDGLRRYIGKGHVQTLDSAQVRITYSLNYVPDSLNPEIFLKDRKILLIGNQINHFYSYYVRQSDSTMTADFDKGKNSSAPVKRSRDIMGEGYQIFANHPNIGQQTVLEFITDLSAYRYEDTMELPQWTLHDDTCTILKYSCQKATTRFHGRDWEVWFSSGIPLDAGPWKLHGLPGLIMRAYDTRRHYVFECIGFEQLKQKKEPIIVPIRFVHHTKCSRQEYMKAQKQFYENQVNSLLALGYNVTIVDNAGNRVEQLATPNKSFEEKKMWMSTTINVADRNKKIPYNPIELE